MIYIIRTALLSSFLFVSISNAQVIDADQSQYIRVEHSVHSHFEESTALLNELDSIRTNIDSKVNVSIEEVGILRRMKSVSNIIPLDYNSKVKTLIDKYTSNNYKPYMNRLHGLSKHYFPVYDKIFEEMGVPLEVRYLSLVESSLNPHLVSTSGAVGPWQFMYATARGYDLDMNTYMDERKDIYSSSYAVAKYLNEAYDQFNDWLLALASYNCGKGCVKRAIQRSGLTNPTFWELSPYLPKETQNYIPKFVAMTYVLSNANYYNIEPLSTELDYETKMVMVDKTVDLRHVAQAVDLDVEKLKYFNPAYKKLIVNGTTDKPKRLLLPLTATINDSLLYVALNTPSAVVLDVKEETILANQNSDTKYRVKKGESLATVSRKFDVSVQDLKAWNNLRNNGSVVGRTLVISKPVNSTLAKNVNRSVQKNSTKTVYYVVKKGDSLERIAKRFDGTSVSKLKVDNGLKNSMIKPGMKLKIGKG